MLKPFLAYLAILTLSIIVAAIAGYTASQTFPGFTQYFILGILTSLFLRLTIDIAKATQKWLKQPKKTPTYTLYRTSCVLTSKNHKPSVVLDHSLQTIAKNKDRQKLIQIQNENIQRWQAADKAMGDTSRVHEIQKQPIQINNDLREFYQYNSDGSTWSLVYHIKQD